MTGRIIIMGSGEIAPTLVGTHRSGLAAAGATTVAVLDTPFGFQTNVEHLTAKLVAFFRTSLVVDTEVVSLRRTGLPVVERQRALAAVRRARYVFSGPGSPSYALGVWNEVGMGDAMADVIAAGGTVTFASAAALTAGRKTVPVYEIYKVGAAPFWLDGLDLTARFGLPMVIVPHWNNAEGGTHDTSRCYIGEARLSALAADLDCGILGVDEHTAAILDFGAGTMSVSGRGNVTLRRDAEVVVGNGSVVDLDTVAGHLGTTLGRAGVAPPALVLPGSDADAWVAAVLDAEELAAEDPAARSKLRSMIVELGDAARTGLGDPREPIAGLVEVLLELRAGARSAGRYEEADTIRRALDGLGIEVRDTRGGVTWDLRR